MYRVDQDNPDHPSILKILIQLGEKLIMLFSKYKFTTCGEELKAWFEVDSLVGVHAPATLLLDVE